QDIPFERVVEVLQPERSLSYAPLFQVMFVLNETQEAQADPSREKGADGLSISRLGFDSRSAQVDLTLSLQETGEGLRGRLNCRTDLVDRVTIRRFGGHFLGLLEEILQAPENWVSTFGLLSDAERHQQLVEWNDTQKDYPADKCIHELFEAQAA